METNSSKYSRFLSKDERKQIKETGECGAEYAAPLFWWKASKGENECRFIEVEVDSLFETPNTRYIATADGIVIAVASNTNVERTFFFECKEYPEALAFYAKIVEVLKTCNN